VSDALLISRPAVIDPSNATGDRPHIGTATLPLPERLLDRSDAGEYGGRTTVCHRAASMWAMAWSPNWGLTLSRVTIWPALGADCRPPVEGI